MGFEAYYGFTGSTATVHLAGDLTDKRVPAVRTLIEQALARPVHRLVLRLHGLDSITAAGVRCLCFAQQQLPAGAEIVVDGASEAIREQLTSGGLIQCCTVVEYSVNFPDESAA